MNANITDFGAISGGEVKCTAAIQRAIDACHAAGGGRVIVRDGIYLTGSIELKSNVNLCIEESGVLLGSPDCADYPERTTLKHVESAMLPRFRNACMIFAEECENISLTGMGKIDCNGTSFIRLSAEPDYGWQFERIDAPTPPRVVFFTGCKNVNIRDITMVNQPSGWSYWIHDCDYVTMDKLKIDADVRYPNNDGIHINSSRNVTVSNCSVRCGDDSLVVRANNVSLPENKVCEKVVVTNCNFTSYSAGIRIGWLNDGTIRNCTFSNIVMTDTSVGVGISLPANTSGERWGDQGREATLVENLSFSNIIMDGIYGTPIKCVVAPHEGTLCAGIRKLHFSNIHARARQFPFFCGRSDLRISDVTLSDCTFERVGDDELPNYRSHGAAAWDRPKGGEIFNFTENARVNNTSFTSSC